MLGSTLAWLARTWFTWIYGAFHLPHKLEFGAINDVTFELLTSSRKSEKSLKFLLPDLEFRLQETFPMMHSAVNFENRTSDLKHNRAFIS